MAMTVKCIKGKGGVQAGGATKTYKDGEFSISNEEGARLVSLGVVQKVAKASTPSSAKASDASGSDSTPKAAASADAGSSGGADSSAKTEGAAS